MVLIEHDMEAVMALANRISVLVNGEMIASGSPEAVVANSRVQEAYLAADGAPDPMLDVTGLHAFYGSSHVLFGVDISIGEGEVIAVLGRNGMGKTTLIRSIMGLLPPREGSLKMDGREIRGRAANVAAKAGIGLVPEGRHIFPNLTTEENLWQWPRTGEKRPIPGP